MAIAMSLEHYLDRNNFSYDIVKHPYASDSLGVAEQAHVSPYKLVKCVMLEDEIGYVMAVCQASTRISLSALRLELNRKLEFATEYEIADLIGDCVLGAIPPVGELYDVDMVVDDNLLNQEELYFEAGDHEGLVHVDAETFEKIVKGAEYASFARPIALH